MAKMKQEKALVSPLKVLAGPEIETLADYLGQGAFGVRYFITTTDQIAFHPLKDSYNDIIAQPVDKANKLCMSTDSNRTEEGNLFPKRTSIEFRSGPEPQNTEELLQLTKAYSDWLNQQKTLLRRSQFKQYNHPIRREFIAQHYLNLSDFITYYNDLKTTTTKLYLTSPQDIFDPKNSGPDFEFRFPEEAQWVLQLSYADLAPKYSPVFTTQYNMSIPIGCVFDPQVKKAFPLATQFSLLYNEKEIAADFNESRPHRRLTEYEEQAFTSAIELADQFFTAHKLPSSAIGAKDFLRGMAYEIAMISTSQNYLVELFQEEALWIAQQHKKAEIAKGGKDKPPTDKEVHEIAISLANTLRKSIFPYFMKTTLADFFKQLHPYEQQLLGSIPEKNIKALCQQAITIANGGVGNTEEHTGHLMFKYDSFMELFDDFYEQTFKGVPVDPENAPADPIGCLTDRFIPTANIGTQKEPINAVVVELRTPAQGKQGYADIQELCTTFSKTHQAILNAFYLARKESNASLDALYSANSKGIKAAEKPHPVIKPSSIPTLPTQAVSASSKPVLSIRALATSFNKVFTIKDIPADGHCLYRSLIEGLLTLYPRSYHQYKTYQGIINHLRKRVSELFIAHPEHYNHLILDEERDRRIAENAPPTRSTQKTMIQQYIAEQQKGIRTHRKTKEPVVHWGSGPELLAIRTHWKESVPNLEIVVVKRNANGNLHLDQDPRDLQGKTLLCVLFEPHRQHYSLLQIKNQLQLLPFLMQVHQQSGGAQASRDAARVMPSAPKASSDTQAMDSEPTRAAPIKLKKLSLASILEQQKIKALAEAPAKSTRSQLKRKVEEAELKSPLSTKSFFVKQREKPALEDNHPKRAKRMGLFTSVHEEASEDVEESSEASHSRKRARRRGP